MQVIVAALVVFANILRINAGTNFDATWTKSCGYGEYIYNARSVHSNYHEDRSWSFYCKYSSKISSSCSWTDYVNWFDEEILYQCPNGVITGVHSYHSNYHEDRRFRFRCCTTVKNCANACLWTGYVNGWDAYMNYYVPNGYFLAGVNSVHDNRKEDRRWRFLICKQGWCRPINSKLVAKFFISLIGFYVILLSINLCQLNTRNKRSSILYFQFYSIS